MRAVIHPSEISDNTIVIPPSKSLAHRAIICASLAEGESIITNVDFSEDIKATIKNMRLLGADIRVSGDQLTIKGGIRDSGEDVLVDANESGSTLRFLIPVFSLLDKEISFTGSGRLMERPLNVYDLIYKEQDLEFRIENDVLKTNGKLKAGEYVVEGNISSQFISGLLFTLPLLEGDSRIVIKNKFESRSYVLLTIDILKKFGVAVNLNDEDNTIDIKGMQKYSTNNYRVEGDFSQLAFFAVLACINSEMVIRGMDPDSLQGDREVIGILRDMNADVTEIEDGYIIKADKLKGCTIDLKNCPDLGPVLMVLAAFAENETRMINAGRLRIKESDRIEAMETELRKLNVEIESDYDNVLIKKSEIKVLDENISAFNDHRVVMAMSVLASVADKKISIEKAEAINKSYPGFFKDLSARGVKVEIYE